MRRSRRKPPLRNPSMTIVVELIGQLAVLETKSLPPMAKRKRKKKERPRNRNHPET